jgi:hypothetical protein
MCDEQGREDPSTRPETMPKITSLSMRSRDAVKDNSPVPMATASTAKVRIAPVASLSLCYTVADLDPPENSTSVAGSVEAMAVPRSKAVVTGIPRTK